MAFVSTFILTVVTFASTFILTVVFFWIACVLCGVTVAWVGVHHSHHRIPRMTHTCAIRIRAGPPASDPPRATSNLPPAARSGRVVRITCICHCLNDHTPTRAAAVPSLSRGRSGTCCCACAYIYVYTHIGIGTYAPPVPHHTKPSRFKPPRADATVCSWGQRYCASGKITPPPGLL